MVCWYFTGESNHSRGSFRWCEMDFAAIHSMAIFSGASNRREPSPIRQIDPVPSAEAPASLASTEEARRTPLDPKNALVEEKNGWRMSGVPKSEQRYGGSKSKLVSPQ